MKLSIIIVNYNVQHFLEQCLLSVKNALSNVNGEVFVVDNNSSDDSLVMLREKFPDIQLIANKENTGFAKANNQAIKLATGEYVLLLNPDTLVEEDTFEKCIAFMDNTPDAGALGVKMINGKGEFLPESKRGLPVPMVAFYKIFGLSTLFPKSKRFGSYHLTYLDNNQTHSVDVLSGAFMMMRKSALDQVGYLDEDYFMYGEDIDLSYRFIKGGYKNYYFHDAKIIHYKGESTKKGSLNYVYVFYKAMQIFAQKHFSRKNSGFFHLLITVAIWFRACFSFLKRVGNILFQPVMDFILIYAGMLALSFYWEHAVLSLRDSAFPDKYRYFILPIYILVWIISIIFCKGYKKPMQFGNTNKGIILGSIVILLAYALLPETFRFSRAVIVFGAMWAVIALNSTRYLFYKLNFKNYILGSTPNRRVLVVGDGEELERVVKISEQYGSKIGYQGTLSVQKCHPENALHLGPISQIKELISLFNIKEIIFCSKNVTTKEIITLISELTPFRLEYKIAPADCTFIIGSNSIISETSSYAMPHSLKIAENRHKKRVFDQICSIILLVFFVINIWFVKEKRHFIHNIFVVLKGGKSWIGYKIAIEQTTKQRIQGVLYPSDLHKISDEFLAQKMDEMYYNEYRLIDDVKMILRGFRNLGNELITN